MISSMMSRYRQSGYSVNKEHLIELINAMSRIVEFFVVLWHQISKTAAIANFLCNDMYNWYEKTQPQMFS
jgi:hypothetical protein